MTSTTAESANIPRSASPASPSQVAPRPPGFVRWRFALLNLVAVYPLITVLLYILMPMTDGWEMWQRTLLLAPLMIVSIVYGIGPFLHKHFGWFLRPQTRR